MTKTPNNLDSHSYKDVHDENQKNMNDNLYRDVHEENP